MAKDNIIKCKLSKPMPNNHCSPSRFVCCALGAAFLLRTCRWQMVGACRRWIATETILLPKLFSRKQRFCRWTFNSTGGSVANKPVCVFVLCAPTFVCHVFFARFVLNYIRSRNGYDRFLWSHVLHRTNCCWERKEQKNKQQQQKSESNWVHLGFAWGILLMSVLLEIHTY